MGQNYDHQSDYLEQYFATERIYYHAIPDDDEPELKLLLRVPAQFSDLYNALEARDDIIMCPDGMQAKDYVLVNLGVETFNPDSASKSLLFDKAGYQARVRTALWPELGVIRPEIEFNLKSKLDNRPQNRKERTVRKEFEAHASTFKGAFELMQRHAGLKQENQIDLSTIDPNSIYVYAIPMSSRAHGGFTHIQRHKGKSYMVQYMPCNDHTAHVSAYGETLMGSDWECEYEARKIGRLRPGHITTAEKKDVIAASEETLRTYLQKIWPDLWLSHRSKMGRAAKLLRKQTGMKEQDALSAWLANEIGVDVFLGNKQSRHFGPRDFIDALAGIAREHLISGQELVRKYIHRDDDAPLLETA